MKRREREGGRERKKKKLGGIEKICAKIYTQRVYGEGVDGNN